MFDGVAGHTEANAERHDIAYFIRLLKPVAWDAFDEAVDPHATRGSPYLIDSTSLMLNAHTANSACFADQA